MKVFDTAREAMKDVKKWDDTCYPMYVDKLLSLSKNLKKGISMLKFIERAADYNGLEYVLNNKAKKQASEIATFIRNMVMRYGRAKVTGFSKNSIAGSYVSIAGNKIEGFIERKAFRHPLESATLRYVKGSVPHKAFLKCKLV